MLPFAPRGDTDPEKEDESSGEDEKKAEESIEPVRIDFEGLGDRIVQVPGDGTPKLAWILWHVLEQQIHHRGELFLCLSLLGKDRPKTDRPG